MLLTPASLSPNKLDISGTVTVTTSTFGVLQAQKGTVLSPRSSSSFMNRGGGSYTESGLWLYPCCWSASDWILLVPWRRRRPLSDRVPSKFPKWYALNRALFLCSVYYFVVLPETVSSRKKAKTPTKKTGNVKRDWRRTSTLGEPEHRWS